MSAKFATYPPSRCSALSSTLARMLKRTIPKSRAKVPVEPVVCKSLIPAGPSIVTQEQAIADTKILMEFYLANAEWDLERERRRGGVADFSKLR